MKARYIVRYLFLAISLGLMGLIFYFSSQNGEDSSVTSGAVYKALYDFFTLFLPEGFVVSVLDYLRKEAHAFIYACLGASVSVCVFTFPLNRVLYWILPFAICLLYAVSDEVHQLFVDGRAGSAIDVCIDGIGFTFSVVVANFIRLLVEKKRRKRQQKQKSNTQS